MTHVLRTDGTRIFQGVAPGDAERLADAFVLQDCRVREPLAAILRPWASVSQR